MLGRHVFFQSSKKAQLKEGIKYYKPKLHVISNWILTDQAVHYFSRTFYKNYDKIWKWNQESTFTIKRSCYN
jgi:hypothetical protein